MVLAIFALPVYAAGAPQINITDPKNGSIVSPGDVTIKVDVKNFNIVSKEGQAKAAGEGHIHYFMDVAAPTAAGVPAVTANGTYVHTEAKSYTWRNVPSGTHTFSVELVNNDHTPLTPPAVDMVRITVGGAANATGQTGQNMTTGTGASGASAAATNMTNATVKIQQPKNGSVISDRNVTVTAAVDNINLVQPAGKNAAGNGHLVFLMDTKAPTAAGQTVSASNRSLMYATNQTTYTWTNVTPGNHSFSVVLVNNDNTTLNPAINDTVWITETGTLNLSTVLAMEKNRTANKTAMQNMPVVAGTARNATSNNMSGNAGKTATVNIVAKNTAFNTGTITVPAGAQVTVNFDNQDSGVQHNVAFYTDSSASKAIYKGQVITGPNKTTYTFTAPSQAGTYFFRCDIHPTQMTGQFIVQ